MHIKGLEKLTLLDYKGYLAATIFTGGCNFTCPFCHNKDLVLSPNAIASIPEENILQFLQSRTGRLEAVCITGGEPTLQTDLPAFLLKIKNMGYKIKLDTNGSSPEKLGYLIQNQLIDYIAMDIKNSKEKYYSTIGIPHDKINKYISNVEQSVQYILQSECKYEFRTTLVQELHTRDDILSICKWIQGAHSYYLQPYRNSPQVIHPIYSAHTLEELLEFQKIAQQYIKNSSITGV